MKNIVKKSELEKMSDIDKCRLILQIIKGQVTYEKVTELKTMSNSLSDYKRLQEEFEQVDHECSRMEKKEVKLEKENERLKNKLLDITKGKKVIEEETPRYIKENYIPKNKIGEILNETEITDFNSLVEAFVKIKKLLESE